MSKQPRAVTLVNFCRDQHFGASLLVLLCVPLAIYLAADVMCYLWSLFVVPFGMPTIGLLHAWGLVLIAQYLVPKTTKWLVDKPEHDKTSEEHLADMLNYSWKGICNSLLFAATAYLAVAGFGPVSL